MIGQFFETISDFLNSGGDVLKVIFVTSFILWAIIVERVIFFKAKFPEINKTIKEKWESRADHASWFAQQIRTFELSKASLELNKNISFIKVLISLCPLLGLLGTVTGMIAVFDVMAMTGTGDARSMASGISMATIPTMAGMVIALSGLFFNNYFENQAKMAKLQLESSMPLEL